MQFLVQFIASFGLSIVIWSIANSKGMDEAAMAARKFGIIAVPFALAVAGLGYVVGKVFGSLGVFVALFVAYLAYRLWPRAKALVSEPGSIIPFALIFPVVWSLLSWSNVGG